MSAEKKFNNCHGCRLKCCQNVFPKPQNIRELHRSLKFEDGQLVLGTKERKSEPTEENTPSIQKKGDKSGKVNKPKLNSEEAKDDSTIPLIVVDGQEGEV